MREFMGISTPAEAIEAMIAGLRENAKRSDFEINMDTFGMSSLGDFCFGCAATCTLEKLAGKPFNPAHIGFSVTRARDLNVDISVLDRFEYVMDQFRKGEVHDLFSFFGVDTPDYPLPDTYWYLRTYGWVLEIPKVEAYLEKLKAFNAERDKA